MSIIKYVVFVLLSSSIFANVTFRDKIVEGVLNKYKDFLENGTHEYQDYSYFRAKPLGRYYTFAYALDHFASVGGSTIVELGTSRSFVSGAYIGCNSDDTKYWEPSNPIKWDWGAGFFTYVAAEALQHLNPNFHTIDICPPHITRCKLMTRPFSHIINYHVISSVNFLRNHSFPNGIDLLYIDTGDMWPLEPTALLQLEEAKVIVVRNLISAKGIILIDDVKNSTPWKFGEKANWGKAKYSIPYFLDNGFEMVIDEYQVVLRKK